MVLQEQIAEVIDTQQELFQKKDIGLSREILHDFPVLDAFAIIITGIRRCGKSTLMSQLLKKNIKNTLYLYFEDPRLAAFDNGDFERLDAEIKRRKIKTLFFDEIQLIENWEMYVRYKLEEGYKVFITGSNASLLSKELGTKLTGRHISVELFPFSYNEFLSFNKLKPSEESLGKYLKIGGMPEYVKSQSGLILNNLLNDILLKDIAVRYGIRDVSSLKQLAVYLISNIGKPFSAQGLTKIFNIKATSTMLEYLSHLENSYLLQFLPAFSYSLKAQARNPKKVYTIDLGLFTENSIVFSDESGRRLENLVYLHLRRNYSQLYYFKEKNECDFVAFDKRNVAELIQVCYKIDSLNLEREYNGLVEAMDFFKKDKGTIVTFSQKDIIKKDGKTVELIPAYEYIMNNPKILI